MKKSDMNNAQQKLQAALKYAIANRPKVGGFPFLAECLRLAGVEKNLWSLPGVQSIYVMKEGLVVNQGVPLVSGMAEVSAFDEQGLITALRIDQAGEGTFPEFLFALWNAGVVSYDVDFSARIVSYYGARGECYQESYLAIEVSDMV